jgi:translation initiation factor 3 subunit D
MPPFYSPLIRASLTPSRFVSRANPKTNDRHVILGVVGWKPRDFAQQMNLSLSNGWGIVRTIADMCLKRDEGKYVLVKDPNKQILRLYEVPADSFEEEEDQGDAGAADEAAEDDE